MKRYLICAACCAVFSGIYEAFSHGVYSVYMLGLCLFPLLLGALPILLLVVVYLVMAAQRHAENPADKILPLPGAMVESMSALIFEPDQLSGQLIFWADTLASLERLGIGLGICRQVVQQHGGRIEVSSTPGTGTRMRVWLPIAGPAPLAKEEA